MNRISADPAPRFEIIEEPVTKKKATKKIPKSSLDRLIYNSKHISEVFTTKSNLSKIRFDELDLLKDIRTVVEDNPKKFEKLKNPEDFRRELRATLLLNYINKQFINDTEEKLLNELLNSKRGADQDALMTALVFLQSHTDLGLPIEENPLWETIFNLSLKDGLQFIDSLTVLREGIDDLKVKNPQILSRDPLILQKSKQICQWPVFWKQLIEHKEILPFEGIISAILRGDVMIELFFDELVHLPFYLYQLFKSDMQNPEFMSEMIPDGDKEKLAKNLAEAIRKSVKKDLPAILPTLIKRIEKTINKARDKKIEAQLKRALKSLKSENELANNIFVIMLIAAKISMKKYWENRRDRFFFFTILKNPLHAKNYFDYGHILIRLKKTKLSENLFRCAIEIEPENFWGYWGIGQYYFKKNKISEAQTYLTSALAKAQKIAIQNHGQYHRELFLIKEDIKKLNRKKSRIQAKAQPQIELFALS